MPDEDEIALRKWMEETFGTLRDDRSTASYALEFLKTGQANLLEEIRLVRIKMAVDGYSYWSEEVVKTAEALLGIAKGNKELIEKAKVNTE
jgi:hypothetical protein